MTRIKINDNGYLEVRGSQSITTPYPLCFQQTRSTVLLGEL